MLTFLGGFALAAFLAAAKRGDEMLEEAYAGDETFRPLVVTKGEGRAWQ